METIAKANAGSLVNLPLSELISIADRVRKEAIGERLELCSIVNAKSGLCSEDCKFCAQSSRHSADVDAYKLKSKDEIFEAARRARGIGAQRFGIVTSGNRVSDAELDVICSAIDEIKRKLGVSLCASLGALSETGMTRLKGAGLERYHHNIETSPRFYPQIASTHNFRERIDTIEAAKAAGLEVCSGGIIGMGETWQDRIDMAYLLKGLSVDSVPINLLVPIKGTRLESVTPISSSDALRTIAIFRIILREICVKIAAGRETILKDFQGMGFVAGANGMLIGGYLTIKGRDIKDDHRLIKEIIEIWKE